MEIEDIAPDLVDKFNQVTPVDVETFDSELASTDVMHTVNAGASRIHCGVRMLDGAAIMLIQAPADARFIVLPEDSA